MVAGDGNGDLEVLLGRRDEAPTPRMGSAMKAAISPSVVVSISDFRSLAQATRSPGT